MAFLMMKLKENASLLIDKMKNLSYLFVFLFLVSCTSNTILKEPEDLIPKDSMRLLIQEMMIASSAKYVKNKNLETKIEYMSLVYDQFKIDSVRFQTSNLYYMSKIDVYQEIFEDAKASLEKQKKCTTIELQGKILFATIRLKSLWILRKEYQFKIV